MDSRHFGELLNCHIYDVYEIWHDKAKSLLTAQTVKKIEFQKSGMVDGRHIENR